MLRRAVSSVCSQSLRDFELIVVDDGSAEPCGGLPLDPRIRMIRNRSSFGVAQARNVGIDAAKGTYISFLDDDDEYLPSFLRDTYATLKISPDEVGVSWCGVKFIDYPVDANAAPSVRVVEFARHEDRRKLVGDFLSIGTGFGVTIKSNCLKKVGTFNRALKVSSDSDMFFRILVNGFTPIPVPGVHVVRHNHREARLQSIDFCQERMRTWENWIFVQYAGFLDENPVLRSNLLGYVGSLKKRLEDASRNKATSQAAGRTQRGRLRSRFLAVRGWLAGVSMRKRVRNLLRRLIDKTLIPSRNDLLLIAEWPILRLAAAFVPERAWFDVAMRVEQAKVLLGFRDSIARVETIRRALTLTDDAPAKNLASRLAASHTEHFIHVLKSSGGGWTPEVQIKGRAHLDAAVAQGNGTILWQMPFFFSMVTKIGLKAAGYPVMYTSLPTHGFSHGPFANRFLNPKMIRAENQYLRKRITIDSKNPGAALLRVRKELANNGVVCINIGAWAGRTVVPAPVLGGWLPLAVGAPGLAHRTGAALLPVFTIRMPGRSAFLIRIGAPLPTGAEASATAISDSVTALAAQLEIAVRSAPDQFTSWEYLAFDELIGEFASSPVARAIGNTAVSTQDLITELTVQDRESVRKPSHRSRPAVMPKHQ